VKRVAIIGGGFAGVAAAKALAGDKNIQVTLFDKKKTFDFLPMLPDAIGRGIKPQFLGYPITKLAEKFSFRFVSDRVEALDPVKNLITLSQGEFVYDYCIIASGAESDFYGNTQAKTYGYTLDSVYDAVKLLNVLARDESDTYVVSGGGYTGVETAAAISAYFKKKSKQRQVIIVEKAPSILGPLPGWMKLSIEESLRKSGVRIITSQAVEGVTPESVTCGGNVFDNAVLIWVAGVRAAGYLDNLNVGKCPKGRLKAGDDLRISDNCFVAGDSACFLHKGELLRMAVQFSINQGRVCAGNIKRLAF